jgi:hypothetical protein
MLLVPARAGSELIVDLAAAKFIKEGRKPPVEPFLYFFLILKGLI